MAAQRHAIAPSRNEDFAAWYQSVIKAADLAEHSVVRGCMIIKPLGYAVWERIQSVMDTMLKDTGHDNVYFPMLIPLSFLQKEADHVEGFAKECAVVTHYRLETNDKGELIPAPSAALTEPYIIRPTSETVIGDAMASWIQSYQDLPVKLNQWANVMRWEMRPRLFLRTSEFLWQEGHTAHATPEEAMEETRAMLDVYVRCATEYLAIPVIAGEKTPGERFPGAVHTYTIEAMMQDGKAVQAGTSHFLGQNFSQAYGIQYLDEHQKTHHVWTTSFGVSTRLIGALILTHSDDDGFVIPPRIAPVHIVIIPMIMQEQDHETIMRYCEKMQKEIGSLVYYGRPISVSIDKSPARGGVKYWNAVRRGTPMRIEVGMREMEADSLCLSRRDKNPKDKQTMTCADLKKEVVSILDDIHIALYDRALTFQKERSVHVQSLAELESHFSGDENTHTMFVYAYCDVDIEDTPAVQEILKKHKISIRCMPFDAQAKEGKCIFSGKLVQNYVILARAY
jgi:prolyl-tRNA synthetase